MTFAHWVFLAVIASAGHAMALLWYIALKNDWRICDRTIYSLPIKERQLKRELKNSVHTPIHAVLLGVCLALGFFRDAGFASFVVTAVATTVWAEIWHYSSHRAMHLKRLHWIHAEHHRSHINTPFTAISFSFWEKLIFDIGMLIPFMVADLFLPVSFFGIATWYIGYLIINSFSHANFEFRAPSYTHHVGKFLTTTTYHSLHHSRYTGNYGLGTRFLDRIFGTEWSDYEDVYSQVTEAQKPLSSLRQKAGA